MTSRTKANAQSMSLINYKINYRALIRRVHEENIRNQKVRQDTVSVIVLKNYRFGKRQFVKVLLDIGQSPFAHKKFQDLSTYQPR